MAEQENKPHKVIFHGFPDEDNLDIKNVLNTVERTFLPIGSELGRYQIIEEIDRGGMAVVYKARQRDLDRIVALKVLPANITINQNFVERFLSEAHSVAKLNHPNIVVIYEVSVESNIYFLAMDYIPGKNLFYYLNQQKPKLVTVMEIVRKLTEALEYAHQQKILHRDLKLNNVIMRDNDEPVLIDFGLAKVIGGDDPELTRTGEIIGSPAYMAPERIFGKNVDERSDICSLGIMLYEMLTFKNPYLDPRSMVQTTKNVVEANPVPPRKLVPWLPIEVESITLKAMAGVQDDRYASMKEFGEDIARFQRGEPILARQPSIFSRVRRFIKKHWAPLAILAISILFTMIIGIIVQMQINKERSGWQLALSESFNNPSSLKEWYVYTAEQSYDQRTGVWSILDSSLYVESNGFTFLRLERPFTRDIRVEFDIRTGLKDLFNAGFFICGSVPDSGYVFRIHNSGAALNAATCPGSSFIFYDYKPVEFPTDSQYHVIVEKYNNIISFYLNEALIAQIYDYFPTIGKNHQRVGFFVNGSSVAFDNLRLYRKAVPRLARPTIIADRFLEQGDFDAALAEYREILLDLSSSDIARQIKFRMIDCLIRLKHFEEAEAIISEIELAKNLRENDGARVLFLRGMLNESKGMRYEINDAFHSLAQLFPLMPENKAAASYLLRQCNGLVERGLIDSAEARVISLTKEYPEYSHHFGRLHLLILNYFTQNGLWNKAQEASSRIVNLQKKNEDILFEAKILISECQLGRREKSKAVDMLNQCLSSSLPSMAKWHAWMILAQVYSFERNYNDAYTIYQKVFNECPKNLPYSWMARINMAETAFTLSQEDPMQLFKYVIEERHIFVQPRLIAQYYSNMIELEYFKRQWQLLNPGDSYYLYYMAQKCIIEGDVDTGRYYLNLLKRLVSPFSWDYVRICTSINDITVSKSLNRNKQSRQ